MDQVTIFRNLRRLTGANDVNSFTERSLAEYVASASDWLAAELKAFYSIEEQMLGLTADESEIALPDDLAWILFVEWDGNRLEPTSHFQSDRVGNNYRTATSANPAQFLVIGRKLILNPPPSDDAVDTDGNLTIRYVSTAPAMSAGGINGLSDMDARLMLEEAAFEWLSDHPSDENAARAQARMTQIQRLLPAAKERADRPILDQSPQFYPAVYRSGAAR